MFTASIISAADIREAIATLLVRLYLIDHHIMLFLPVGGHIKFREKHLARVLHAREEIDDVVLFLVHSLLLLHAVSNTLRFEDIAPKRFGNLNVVLDRRRIFQLRFLRHPNELLDIVPLALEERGIIRNGIIRAVRRRHTTDHGKLAFALLHLCLQVRPRTLRVELWNDLHLFRPHRVAPIRVQHLWYHALLVCWRKANIASLLAQHPHHLVALLIENYHAHGKTEVFEVLANTEKITRHVVIQEELLDLVHHFPFAHFISLVHQSASIAHLCIEHLASAQCLITLNQIDNVIRHLVVCSPRHIAHLVAHMAR